MKLTCVHSDSSLQAPWQLSQLGLLTLQLSPFLGCVSIGLAALLTWRRKYRTIIRHPRNWTWGLFGVWLVVSAMFAHERVSAYLGIFNILPFLVFLAGFTALIQNSAQLRHLARIFVVSSLPVAIIGYGQMFWGWGGKWQFLWIVLDIAIFPGGEPPGRMSSVFMHANILAAYLAMALTLGLGLWLEELNSPRINYKYLIFLSLSLIANLIALLLTNSRNGWVMAMVVCLAYAIYQGWRLMVGGVMGVVTSVILAAFAPAPVAQVMRRLVPAFFWARLNDAMYPDRPDALMRITQWRFAWNMTQARPVNGWGLRSFSDMYGREMGIYLGHPHNLFLMLAAETGLPGLLLFCGSVGWVLFVGMQLLQKSALLNVEDKLMLYSYVLVIVNLIIFNTVDVSLFDLRLNTMWWFFLFATAGFTDKMAEKPITYFQN